MRSLICIIFLLMVTAAQADDVFVIVMQKQQEKREKGWSLLGWMETKKKVALMDQWLALNSAPSAPEFYFNIDTARYKYLGSRYNLYRGSVGAFISIFGIEAEYESSEEKYSKLASQLSVRILGSSNQYTNITLHYGYRDFRDTHNQYVGANLTLNILSFVGVNASYNRHLTGSNSGDGYTLGPFVDLVFFRIYAHWFKETVANIESTGTRLGLKMYF